MKTLGKIFLMITAISLIAGCNKTEDQAFNNSSTLKSGKTHEVTVPFKVDFNTIEAEDGNGSPCDGAIGDDAWMSAHQIGEGTGTHLGNFSVDAAFCFCVGPNEFGKYINANFVFTAANGDELYGTVDEGLVVFFNEPDEKGNVAVYNDLMIITGGTGRFVGASGAGYVDSYLPLPGTIWQHSIDSTITLVKGKRR